MSFNPPIVFQTMVDPGAVSEGGAGPIDPGPPTPKLSITGPLGDVMEGGHAQFAVNRTNNVAGDASVTWTATAPAGDTDSPLTGTLFLPSGYNLILGVIKTVDRAGLQAEPRQIHITLSSPSGAALDPAASVLDIPIRNRTATPGTWWNMSRRSGRAWASGTALMPGTLAVDPNASLEQTVALNDAGMGHSRGANNDRVATWDQVIGGAVGGPINQTNTQFQWDESSSFGLHFLRFPNSAGWLIWDVSLIPTDRATNTGNSSIWNEIANGTHDAKYQAMGARIASAFAAKGHDNNRFIGVPHCGMNNSGYFQVFDSTRLAYKAAMERAITQIRAGANVTLRFAHCPGQYPWIGNLAGWTPNNFDAIGLDYDVQSDIVDADHLAWLLDNTHLTIHYGLRTDVIDVADRLNLPMIVPRWIVQNDATLGCPYSYQAVQRFYDDFLQPNAARIVADCLQSTVILNASGYQGPGGAPATQSWSDASALFKSRWSGIKAVVAYTPPTISISAVATTVQEG